MTSANDNGYRFVWIHDTDFDISHDTYFMTIIKFNWKNYFLLSHTYCSYRKPQRLFINLSFLSIFISLGFKYVTRPIVLVQSNIIVGERTVEYRDAKTWSYFQSCEAQIEWESVETRWQIQIDYWRR